MRNYSKYLGFIFIFIGTLILVIVPQLKGEKEGQFFYISGHGEVLSEQPKEVDTLVHSITLENPGKKNYTIKSIEPIINEEIKPLLIDNKTNKTIEIKKLKGKNEVEYKGEIKIRTIQLNEDTVKKLMPAIKEYKIIYDNGKEVILKSGS